MDQGCKKRAVSNSASVWLPSNMLRRILLKATRDPAITSRVQSFRPRSGDQARSLGCEAIAICPRAATLATLPTQDAIGAALQPFVAVAAQTLRRSPPAATFGTVVDTSVL